MKRFFTSDSESDMLIAVAANFYDLKTEELINMAIKNEFLPVTEPFRTEAAYILQRKAEGQLNDWEIKQCMSRGVRALGLRPIRNEENLKEFFARYHLSDVVSDSSITENDTLGKATVEIYTILDKELPADNIDGTYLLETIFANWDSLWHVKAVYDILATLAFCCKPNQPFGWYEGIQFLVRIERDAMNEWNGIQG